MAGTRQDWSSGKYFVQLTKNSAPRQIRLSGPESRGGVVDLRRQQTSLPIFVRAGSGPTEPKSKRRMRIKLNKKEEKKKHELYILLYANEKSDRCRYAAAAICSKIRQCLEAGGLVSANDGRPGLEGHRANAWLVIRSIGTTGGVADLNKERR